MEQKTRDRLIALCLVAMLIPLTSLGFKIANAETIGEEKRSIYIEEGIVMINITESEWVMATNTIDRIKPHYKPSIVNITVVWNFYEYCQKEGDIRGCDFNYTEKTKGSESGGVIHVEIRSYDKFAEVLCHEVGHAIFPHQEVSWNNVTEEANHQAVYDFGYAHACLR